MRTAFVLGGGGVLGAHEVGMLRALSEAGIRPDVIVGTSVGAINGVFVAADPADAAERLGKMWLGDALQRTFSEPFWVAWSGWRVRARTCIRSSRCAACWTTCFRGGLRRSRVAFPLRCGQHRTRMCALVQQRADRARRPGLVCGTWAAATC